MEKKLRIGVFVSSSHLPLFNKLISGIFDFAKNKSIDVILLYSQWEPDPKKSFKSNEANLCELSSLIELDGAILIKGDRGEFPLDEIAEKLSENNIHVVICDLFRKIRSTPDPIYHLTEHLIKKHSCKHILLYNTAETTEESRIFADNFRSAMQKNGLGCPDENIIYESEIGGKADVLTKKIHDKEIGFPDGIICASDIMAAMVIDKLHEYEINVPGDICVCARASSECSDYYRPTITTVIDETDYNMGYISAVRLYEKIKDIKIDFDPRNVIKCGMSCGCKESVDYPIHYSSKFIEYINIRETDSSYILHSKVRDDDCIEKYLSLAADYAFISYVKCSMYVFLYENWENQQEINRNPQNMILVMSKSTNKPADLTERHFSAEDLIHYSENSPSQLYIISSLNHNDHTFGFCVLKYDGTHKPLPGFFSQLCSIISEIFEMKRNDSCGFDLSNIRQSIYQDHEKDFDVNKLAAELGFSYSHFQRLYYEKFGVRCKRDIIKSKMEQAKKLLKETNLSVKEIAEKCGYENASYFMRQFKKEVGITALQFRKNRF